jgi:aldehyde:ferredoxin oxidoreductase
MYNRSIQPIKVKEASLPMNPTTGYWGKILHIDLTRQASRVEKPTENWYRLYAGGGLMGAFFLLRDTPPRIDPFSPQNLLIFLSSVVAGLEAPGLARFSVVTKSPLSEGIAEVRCEGGFGRSLKTSGYDAVILSGQAITPTYLELNGDSVIFHPADHLWGQDTCAATDKIAEETGISSKGIAVIGQAGERRVRFASIISDYSVAAARMGAGAVMGAKNLKGLALQPGPLPEVADPACLKEISNRFLAEMPRNTLSMWQKDPPGFSAAADLSDFDTAYIGIHNYRSDLQVANSDFTRAKYMDFYRGANPCPGCPNDCIKWIAPDAGTPDRVSGIHQEVTGAMGPNLGNTSLKLTLKVNELCNRYGLDPVSLGFSISFAMECFENGLITLEDSGGLALNFGNQDVILPMVEMIAARSGFGDTLAEGIRRSAQKIGKGAQAYALHVKGIEMVSFEPRTQTNLALGYATAPVGPRYDICEHDWDFDVTSGWEHTLTLSRTLGILERIPMQYLGIEKLPNYMALYTLWSACDALNICIFAAAPTRLLSLETMTKLVEGATGWKSSSYEFMRWGERRDHLMRIYNLREGLTRTDDTLPERFFQTPIDFGRLKGTVLEEKIFSEMVDTLYEMKGWDRDGVPLLSTLVDHHLEWCAPILANLFPGPKTRNWHRIIETMNNSSLPGPSYEESHMSNQELRDLLEKVHAEIERTETVDDKGRELLRDLDSDIRHLLDSPENSEDVIEQLENSIQHFEVTHPVFTTLLNRLMEILSGAGI